ncbi:MAG: carbohydrate kinase family protein, partial [Candidatus Hydrogenedentota bacterium]
MNREKSGHADRGTAFVHPRYPVPEVVVLGSPSLDFIRKGDRTETMTGGNALFAAMGAELAGAEAAILGRWPESFAPNDLAALACRVDTSRLLIVAGRPGRRDFLYDASGHLDSSTESAGLETLIAPAEIPSEWSRAKAVIVPLLGHPSHQLAHLMWIRASTEIPLVAVTLAPGVAHRERGYCIDILRNCDVAFLSLADACVMADSADVFAWLEENVRWSIVSMGAAGVAFVSGGPTRVLRLAFEPVDITGAEDALAGAVIGSLSMGRPIENALLYGLVARHAASTDLGLQGLYSSDRLHISPDASGASATSTEPVVPDFNRIAALARIIGGGGHKAFTFTAPEHFYPPVDHPRALEYFFAVVMHQYGFWNLDDGAWAGSMFGVVDGIRLKGSDFVWRSATKALLEERDDLTEFLDDDGRCPLPMLDTHREFSRRFREYSARTGPRALLDEALACDRPLEKLLDILDDVPGYSGDKFRKKSMLLAMTLVNRPEKFLRARGEAELSGWAPVVDYHIQRTSLRTGIVLPLARDLRDRLNARRELAA